MAIPDTYKTYRRTTGTTPLTITQTTETTPKNLGPKDVLLKVHSVSLNYRDIAMLSGAYPAPVVEQGVPASDAAAEVVAVGSAVQQFKVGDRVSPNFFVNYFTGEEREPLQGLGGDVEGVLREYAVFDEEVLVPLPEHLSWDEASTIACAGVTAWSSLDGLKKLSPESSYVLLEGTGGVSMFALLLLIDAGIKTIITSSSDAKIAQLQKLSPLITGVNYKSTPDIAAEVQRITGGRGADIIINNIGPASIASNIDSLATEGSIKIVGFLGGFTGDWNPSELLKLLFKRATMRGISVGTKLDFETLNAHLSKRKISLQPLVDRVFALDEAKDAVDHMVAGRHVGKIIVKVAE
ncbi:GroES-like protein [Trichoderma chlorosporum]